MTRKRMAPRQTCIVHILMKPCRSIGEQSPATGAQRRHAERSPKVRGDPSQVQEGLAERCSGCKVLYAQEHVGLQCHSTRCPWTKNESRAEKKTCPCDRWHSIPNAA